MSRRFGLRGRTVYPPFNGVIQYAGAEGFDYLQQAEFVLPLEDLGAGAVNTALGRGVGSPTFTRATVAWTKLSSGLWASVATGVARSSYIGLTTAVGAYGGYFAEGAGIQLVTPTASIRDMTNAAWTKGATMTAAMDGVGIDGAANSCSRLTGGAVSATNTAFQTLVAAASTRTYSAWIKRVTGTGVINITQDGGVGYTDVTSQINSSTFTLVQLSASALNAAFGIQVVTSGDVILVDFNQFEAGAFATSPMAAAGAARNADVLSFASTGNFSNTAGWAYGEVTLNGGTGKPRIITDSTTGGGPLLSNSSTTVKTEMFDGAVEIIVANSGALQAIHKVATSWGGVAGAVVLNGGTVATDVYDGSMITNNISICSFAGSQWYGQVKNLRIGQRQLPNATLQAITA